MDEATAGVEVCCDMKVMYFAVDLENIVAANSTSRAPS